MTSKTRRGKLIVIDGTDGSGKATQTELLIKHLKLDGQKVKVIDFPEYSNNFFGAFIGHCLSEQYYNFVKVHPKIASVLYAADRFESKEKIEQWLKEGNIVIADRYASANQIHQGGKISNVKKRQAFLKWLAEMEYEVFKIPRPDAVFYLNVPIPVVMKLIKSRNQGKNKNSKKKSDVVEKDLKYMENSRKSALWLSQTQSGWVKIECMAKGALMPREKIHEKLYDKVKKIIK